MTTTGRPTCERQATGNGRRGRQCRQPAGYRQDGALRCWAHVDGDRPYTAVRWDPRAHQLVDGPTYPGAGAAAQGPAATPDSTTTA